MTYDFLIKAKEQPDLSDFCNYIEKPLKILEEIQYRYKSLQLSKKTELSNLEIYHKCDSILERHLPQMVDNYCDFSFDYRNNNQIKLGDKLLTPKEIILKNLAKVIEEIKLIEIDFNENNKIVTIAHNRVLNSYGNQPEICLESGKVVKNELQLNNHFDYNNFIKNDDFKKIAKTKTEIIKPKYYIANKTTIEESKSNNLISRILLGLLLISGSLLTYRVYNYNTELNLAEEAYFQKKLSNLHTNIHILYFDKKNDDDFSNQTLIKEPIFTPWGTAILLQKSKIKTKNDSYSIKFNMPEIISDEHSTACSFMSTVINNYPKPKKIIADNNVIMSSDTSLSNNKFLLNCVENKYQNIELINTLK